LLLFAFDLYDGDSSGKIDVSEVGGILKEIYGSQFMYNPNAQRIFQNFLNHEKFCPLTADGSDELGIRQFSEFVNCHPSLLWPAFQIQETLRENFGGKSMWAKLSRIRIELSHGEYIDVNQILSAHIDPTKFQEILYQNSSSDLLSTVLEDQIHRTIDIVNTTGPVSQRKKEAKFINPFSHTLNYDSKSQDRKSFRSSLGKFSRRLSSISAFPRTRFSNTRKARPITDDMVLKRRKTNRASTDNAPNSTVAYPDGKSPKTQTNNFRASPGFAVVVDGQTSSPKNKNNKGHPPGLNSPSLVRYPSQHIVPTEGRQASFKNKRVLPRNLNQNQRASRYQGNRVGMEENRRSTQPKTLEVHKMSTQPIRREIVFRDELLQRQNTWREARNNNFLREANASPRSHRAIDRKRAHTLM